MSDLFKEIIDITKRDKKDFFQTYAKIGEESGELALYDSNVNLDEEWMK